MSYDCHMCGKSFANASNRHRHIKGIYLNKVHEAKTHPRTEQPLAIGSTVNPERIIWSYGQWQPIYHFKEKMRLGS